MCPCPPSLSYQSLSQSTRGLKSGRNSHGDTMRVRASIAALLVSFPSAAVIIAEATNSTSSESNTTSSDFVKCIEEISCMDTSCLECFNAYNTVYNESSESLDYSEYVECIQNLPTIDSVTYGSCYSYRTYACCSSELYAMSCSEFYMQMYTCYMDYDECPSEYYSCTEGALGEGSASSDNAFGGGSASSNATGTTGNDQLSRLVCAIALIFTITFAMGL